jgi:formyltetrahydrofolate-dependent phosphoribosylglycinamide formyltransferase
VAPKFSSPAPIAVLLSGGGRTLEYLAAWLESRPELGRIVLVISDRASAGGLARAERRGIPRRVMPCRTPADSAAIFAALAEAGIELAVLGGFLRLLRIPPRWLGRVLNIHPSLIPAHAGPGFYGDRVHRSVLASGDRRSGCTVHFVDDAYDHGPVIDREIVPVEPGDTASSLAERVFAAERIAYPRAIERLLRGEVSFPEEGKHARR